MNTFWRTALEVGSRCDRAGIAYCVIKTYGGDPQYNDGNVDLLVDRSLWDVYDAVLADDFRVSRRDRIKNRLYERNKLMGVAEQGDLAQIHLHRSVGWHNICFMSAQDVLARSTDVTFADGAVRVADKATESRMFVLHIIFEQFAKNEWDLRFLCGRDFDDFADQFGVPPGVIAKVRDAGYGHLAFADLRPIWNRYYRNRRRETNISLWNRFLHWGLTRVQQHRRRKAARQSL